MDTLVDFVLKINWKKQHLITDRIRKRESKKFRKNRIYMRKVTQQIQIANSSGVYMLKVLETAHHHAMEDLNEGTDSHTNMLLTLFEYRVEKQIYAGSNRDPS